MATHDQLRLLVCEAFGTFVLVFAGTGAIVVNDTTGAVTHVGVALTFGLVVFVLVSALGDVSGAHLNPAVTLGLALAGRFPARRVGPYLAAQLAGAFAASGLLGLMYPDNPGLGGTHPTGPAGRSFVFETVLTLVLMVVVLIVSAPGKGAGQLAGAVVGGVIGLEALFAGPECGASMNPARSLAPAVVSGHAGGLWIYLTAPVLGAALAVPLARFLLPPPDRGRPMPLRLLFVCVENSNRSQMAEAFARKHGGDAVEAYSAGSRPSGVVNPRAVQFMAEVGCDLSTHASKPLADIPPGEYAAAVTMGCGDACPLVAAGRRVDWQIPDPKHLPDDEFRQVRELIEQQVLELLASLGVDRQAS